jgi:hypothetical protein
MHLQTLSNAFLLQLSKRKIIVACAVASMSDPVLSLCRRPFGCDPRDHAPVPEPRGGGKLARLRHCPASRKFVS